MGFKNVLGALCLLVISSVSFAAGEIVVVDMRAAIFKSDMGALEAEKLKASLAHEQADLMGLQTEIKEIEIKMGKDSAVMSADEVRKMKQGYADKVSDYKHQAKKYQGKAKEAEQSLSKKMLPEFQRALKSVVEEKKYGVVLPREVVLDVATDRDITDAVVAKMNNQ